MKYFIWDFDGTLFDTYDHTVKLLYKYAKELGKSLDYCELYRISRQSLGQAKTYCRLSDEEWKAFNVIEGKIDEPPVAGPYCNTEKVLSAVKENGGNNFIYTHRDAVTFQYLEKYNMMKYFGGFVTRENNFPYKPSPEAIQYIMKRYNLPAEETIMVGDREIDILSGKNAGICSCLFTEGNPDTSIAENTAADYTAENMLSLGRLFFPAVFK